MSHDTTERLGERIDESAKETFELLPLAESAAAAGGGEAATAPQPAIPMPLQDEEPEDTVTTKRTSKSGMREATRVLARPRETERARSPQPIDAPKAPGTIEETGLHPDILHQLLVKTLIVGTCSGTELAERLRLPYSVLESLVSDLRVEHLVEVRGANGSGTAGYRYALTDLGRERAARYLEVNQYVGPAPVPLAQYAYAVSRAASARPTVDADRVREGFSHLVVEPRLMDELGPAINSGKSVFLYGPPGNGKTVIAEGIGRALGGDMYVPYALDVDGQVITLYDPINHEALEEPDLRESIVKAAPTDRRWVRIKRPVITVGGELTLEMLDLRFNVISKFYEAPIQLKANGGVFVVDDFGRQRVRPRDLLNRWIVPLESRVDFLTLHTGKMFEIPFDVLIVFATNLDPSSLADEAFLRRIRYKIAIHDPSVDQFAKIFELNCRRVGLHYDGVIVEYLQRKYFEPRHIPMRACQPRDLVEHILDLASYTRRPAAITRELLDKACESYFLEETQKLAGGAAPAAGTRRPSQASRLQ